MNLPDEENRCRWGPINFCGLAPYWRDEDAEIVLAVWRASGQNMSAFAELWQPHASRNGRWNTVASTTEVGCYSSFKAHDDDPRSAYVLLLVRRLFKLEKLADAGKLTPAERTEFRQRR